MNFLMSSDDNQKHFDYSLLNPELSENLQNYDKQLNRIHQGYSIEVGEVLYNAQQEFSNPKDGNFIKWVEYKGFKSSNAYNYINIYKAFQSLESISDKEIFLEQSKSLQIEMSKPSAKPEINQMVYDGEITKHKDYIEREREFNKREEKLNQRLKQQSEIIENKNSVIAKQSEELGKLRKQEPKVVEKPVIPEDYEDLKRTKDYLTKRNEHLEREHQDLLNQRKEVKEKSQKYDELTNAIQQSQGELNRVQQQIADYDGLHKVLKEGNTLLAKLSVLVYSDLSDAVANDVLVKNELGILLNRFSKLNNDINKKITNNMIIEGEIIND